MIAFGESPPCSQSPLRSSSPYLAGEAGLISRSRRATGDIAMDAFNFSPALAVKRPFASGNDG